MKHWLMTGLPSTAFVVAAIVASFSDGATGRNVWVAYQTAGYRVLKEQF
jgi:hypothetical protein